MKPVVFIKSGTDQTYTSALFNLFSNSFTRSVQVRSSYLNISADEFNVFTSLDDHVTNLIDRLHLDVFGLVLEGKSITEDLIPWMLRSAVCYVIGDVSPLVSEMLDRTSVLRRSAIIDDIPRDEYATYVTCEAEHLLDVAEAIVHGDERLCDLHVLLADSKAEPPTLVPLLAELGVRTRFYRPTHAMYRHLVANTARFVGSIRPRVLMDAGQTSSSEAEAQPVRAADLALELSTFVNCLNAIETSDVINIVCYKPTYLFKDLVDRFTAAGCVHSDFPLKDAKSYIWMRPQELWHYAYLEAGIDNPEISMSYRRGFEALGSNRAHSARIRPRSIAIHHGTCFAPLYQFDSTKLAHALAEVRQVVGVCEYEECYGPAHHIANPDNFVFVPIGYDPAVFSEAHWKRDEKPAGQPLKIGYVGRAYGTNNKIALARSDLAEPKGYRKGGDHLINIGLRLKALSIPFEFHILGANWDELVDDLARFGIPHRYHARDIDLTYRDYPRVYAEMDILLISARCEGGPVSAIEALSLGVNVVSTNVGVVKYLAKQIEVPGACRTFDYDKKWQIADIDAAVGHILDLYENPVSESTRAEIRASVATLTTNAWVDTIIAFAHETDAPKRLSERLKSTARFNDASRTLDAA